MAFAENSIKWNLVTTKTTKFWLDSNWLCLKKTISASFYLLSSLRCMINQKNDWSTQAGFELGLLEYKACTLTTRLSTFTAHWPENYQMKLLFLFTFNGLALALAVVVNKRVGRNDCRMGIAAFFGKVLALAFFEGPHPASFIYFSSFLPLLSLRFNP